MAVDECRRNETLAFFLIVSPFPENSPATRLSILNAHMPAITQQAEQDNFIISNKFTIN